MPRRFEFKRLFNIWVIFGLALLIRWCAAYLYYFVYKTPGGLPPDPTATEVYELLARELIEGRGLQSWLFAYRPPLEPMFIALTYVVTGAKSPVAAVFAQTFVSASICLLAYQIAKELGADENSRKIVALLTAVDPASIGIGLVLMAETLSNFFIAASLVFLARLLKSHRLRDAAACAAGIVLAALARPNAIYFAAIVVVAIVVLTPRWLAKAGLFLGVFVLGVMPWHVRNYAYHNLFTFATTGSFNLLFYQAVSVERWATGKEVHDIEAEFAYELDKRLGIAGPRETYDHNSIWRQLVPTDPRADRLMRDMAFEVYLKHPLSYILVIPLHLSKLLAYTDLFAPFAVARWLEMAFNFLFYSLTGLGGILFWRKRLWVWLAATVAPAIYFIAVPLVTGGVQDTRARTSITVCLAVMAAEGLMWLWQRRYKRPAAIQPV